MRTTPLNNVKSILYDIVNIYRKKSKRNFIYDECEGKAQQIKIIKNKNNSIKEYKVKQKKENNRSFRIS